MKLTLNVGRDLPSGGRLPTCVVQLEAVLAVRHLDSNARCRCTWKQSETEETLVLVSEVPDEMAWAVGFFMTELAVSLGQDCVAVLLEHAGETRGELYGPRAAAWEPFSLAHFIKA